jgi:Terminase-like family.
VIRRKQGLWPAEEPSTSLGSILTAVSDLTRVRPLPDVAYQRDPVGWARDVLGIPEHVIRWSLNPGYAYHGWDGTVDPLALVAETLARGQDVGVESGTGTGKTWLGGWLAPWFLVCFEDGIVVTIAPKAEQLELHLWKELNANFSALRRSYPSLTRAHLRMRARPVEVEDDDDVSQDKWAIIGYGCGVDAETSARGATGAASRAKGFHAPHMLVITEETQGMPPAVMTALANTCTGDHNLRLAFGNPESQTDELHRFCKSSGVAHVRISALDHPNVVTATEVVAGAVGLKSVERRREEYRDAPTLFDAQVRGISPAQAAQALIKRDWLERAANRFHDPDKLIAFRKGRRALGVDVANSLTGDKAAIAHWQGATLLQVDAMVCPDSNQLGRDVFGIMGRDNVDPEAVGVDPVGVGAGTVNELARLTDYRGPRSLNGAATPLRGAQKGDNGEDTDWMPDSNAFNNLRSQMWWQMREDLRCDRVAIPRDEALWDELSIPRFMVKDGKTQVEAKDAIKRRLGGRSPDRADAVVYGNWVRRREAEPQAPVPPDVAGRDSAMIGFTPYDESGNIPAEDAPTFEGLAWGW